MQNISIKRIDCPEHQGVIEPADGSWKVLINKDGLPQTMVRVKYEADDGSVQDGWLDVQDIPEGVSVHEVMEGVFGGKLSPEEEVEAAREYEEVMAKRWGRGEEAR